LTLPNLLLKLKSIDDWTENEIYQYFGAPVQEEIQHNPKSRLEPGESAPRYIVETAKIPPAQFLRDDICLVDFGEAFQFDEPPKPENIGIPFMYRAPEAIFDFHYNRNSEIWALACVLFEVRAGNPLFTSIMGGADEIIQQMVQMKGKLPDRWWKRWDKRTMCFGEDGRPHEHWPDGRVLAVQYPLGEMLGDIGSEDDDNAVASGPAVGMMEQSWTKVPADEREDMKDLLDSMLQWDPKKRLSLEQIRKHRWITG
jgi:serine/threonine protein kinase